MLTPPLNNGDISIEITVADTAHKRKTLFKAKVIKVVKKQPAYAPRLAAMGSGMGAGLSMMFGGGGNKQAHELILRLGSSSAPAGGAPKADHFMPAVAKLGASVPLVSPKPGTRTDVPEQLPKDFQRPKGRLLI